MPIHDWTRVKPGIFHDFHHEWISEIKRSLNRGLLPPGYYALAEQIVGSMGPDVLALETVPPGPRQVSRPRIDGGVAVEVRPPKARYHVQSEVECLTRKAKAVVVRQSSDHRVIAMIELVSPGNKASQTALMSFARKAREAIESGIHLLIVDLFPPGPRDPEGIHNVIWEGPDGRLPLDDDAPLTCVAYVGCPGPEIYMEPAAVGGSLPEMPLFLTPEIYVPVPLEATYLAAWEAVPAYWRDALNTQGLS